LARFFFDPLLDSLSGIQRLVADVNSREISYSLEVLDNVVEIRRIAHFLNPKKTYQFFLSQQLWTGREASVAVW
jgi:hypothetical protein